MRPERLGPVTNHAAVVPRSGPLAAGSGWLTVLDGPLHGIRHRRGLPVIGYLKTHHAACSPTSTGSECRS